MGYIITCGNRLFS